MSRAACKGCGAEIVWLRTAAGKAMPVNAESVDDPDATEFDPAAGHESHFADCPEAKAFRRTRPDTTEPERTDEQWSKVESI